MFHSLPITLDFISKVLMLLVILQGLFVSIFSWLQKTETTTARFLYSSLITAVSLTLLNDLLHKFNVFTTNPKWLFLPIFYTMSFGPLLFFYVKAALYKSFRLQWKDIKHFMLPMAQVFFFAVVFFFNPETKQEYWRNDYNLFYGTFSYPIYLIIFTIYAYFAYRFIRHKIKAFQHIAHDKKENHQTNRLRQVIKGWYLLLLINSSFIVLNFFTEYFFHTPLNNNTLYLFFNEMSFVAMVAWLAAYGYYKVAKGLGVWDFVKSKFVGKI